MRHEICLIRLFAVILQLTLKTTESIMRKLYTILLGTLLAACGWPSADDDAEDVAEAWAEAYFNCDYKSALALSTPDSERWLRFAASNTSQAMLDLCDEQPAEVSVDGIYAAAADTLRVVTVRVSHYVAPTAIGATPMRADEGVFTLPVVQRSGRWLVRMACLPRSEMQSRD